MIEALTDIATKLAPEVLRELVLLARMALGGSPKAEIVSQAERFATLAIYKQSYRRAGGR